jgi:hypothetical protein
LNSNRHSHDWDAYPLVDFLCEKAFNFHNMNNIINLPVKTLRKAATLKWKIQKLENQLQKLLGSTEATSQSAPKKRRKMSRSGRARIAAAARARWAKVKGRKSAAKSVKKARRKMSAAAKAKIAAAARARWKKAKAAGKNSL